MRRRIMHWLWDGKPGWLTLALWSGGVGRLLCLFAGHEPICTHHHRPERDYCCWCMKRMPGKAHR